MYRLFDTAVACDFPLTGIPEMRSGEAAIRVTRGQGGPADCDHGWLHSWHNDNSESILACARVTDGKGVPTYLLRFAGLADFAITGTAIRCHPHPGCEQDSLRHLLLDQVIPRLWAHIGHLVLHASAVQLPDGRVVAFLGKSGRGKSTLAAAMHTRGCRLLSDDSIWLRAVDGRVQLVPGYPGLRLNDDSIATLGLPQRGWTGMSHYSGKRRFEILPAQRRPSLFLDRLYILAERGAAGSAPSLTAAAGAGRVTTLIRHSFLLDVRDIGSAKDQFVEAASVLRAGLRCFNLAYPREYPLLDKLCDCLLARGTP